MVNIDYIMELFDWNNTEDDWRKGLILAKQVKCVSAFIQPGYPYGKRVWDNCAKVFYEKNDQELKPYLFDLLEWLSDLTWPGAMCIFKRLKIYKKDAYFNSVIQIALRQADLLEDENWRIVLSQL